MMRYELLAGSETQLMISKELEYLNKEGMKRINEKLGHLAKMITVLIGKFK